jgi:uncharacterized protein YbjQ (UPF0145 family)
MAKEKDFYGITQNQEIPGAYIKEVKGVVWTSHLCGAQYGFDLTANFTEQAQKLGGNAVTSVTTKTSDKYIIFTGTVVVAGPTQN